MFELSSKFQRFKKKGNIWQLFHATNFESLMYPCLTFCYILGIFPYKIKTETIKTCKQGCFLSIIFICYYCTYVLMVFCTISEFEHINIPQKLLNIYCAISSISIIIVTFILNKPRMRLIQTLLKVSLRLPSESYQNLSRLIHAKDILGVFFIIIYDLMLFIKNPYVLGFIYILYVDLLMFQIDMLYMNCVCVIKACFKQINDNLVNLQKIMMNDKSYVLKETYHKQRNPFLLIKIKALKKQHLMITDTVQVLNMIFNLQLLATIITTFMQVTFVLYFYLMHWKIGMVVNNYSNQAYDLSLIVNTTYFSLKMLLIIWTCESAKNQAAEINIAVHYVLNNTSDEQIKYELQLFSLQLKHCKNIFSVKAFTLDATLLTTMAGAITTYLLILIQFLFIPDSCILSTNSDVI